MTNHIEINHLGVYDAETCSRDFITTLRETEVFAGRLAWVNREKGVPGLILVLEATDQIAKQPDYLGRQGALLEVRDDQMAISTLKQMLSRQ